MSTSKEIIQKARDYAESVSSDKVYQDRIIKSYLEGYASLFGVNIKKDAPKKKS